MFTLLRMPWRPTNVTEVVMKDQHGDADVDHGVGSPKTPEEAKSGVARLCCIRNIAAFE